jgi:hypothetical protein
MQQQQQNETKVKLSKIQQATTKIGMLSCAYVIKLNVECIW